MTLESPPSLRICLLAGAGVWSSGPASHVWVKESNVSKLPSKFTTKPELDVWRIKIVQMAEFRVLMQQRAGAAHARAATSKGAVQGQGADHQILIRLFQKPRITHRVLEKPRRFRVSARARNWSKSQKARVRHQAKPYARWSQPATLPCFVLFLNSARVPRVLDPVWT